MTITTSNSSKVNLPPGRRGRQQVAAKAPWRLHLPGLKY